MSPSHPIVSRDQWLAQRRELLREEKELTAMRDRLSAKRRGLPWVKIDERYVFETTSGKRSLLDLFGGRTQLAVYHFMFAPEWEAGCKSCSFWADSFDHMTLHVAHRDVTFLAVSRAPLAKLQAFKQRMGWSFAWVSSFESSFNRDFGVSFTAEQLAQGELAYNLGTQQPGGPEMPGISVFARDGEQIFHTYSAYARGIDMMNAAYQWLDLVPKGRDEQEVRPMSWLKLRDQYVG
jgi:predicted dithiol-disulfide oxidoreductase (DUF899 family)